MAFAAAVASACAGDGTGLDQDGNPIGMGGTVTISVSRLSLPVGGSTVLIATVEDANGNVSVDSTVTWSSSNGSVVSVDADGLATGVGAGTARVTATTMDGANGAVDAAIVASAGFAADVQPIFDGSCAFSGCHAAPSPQQGLNLSAGVSYGHIVGVASNQLPTMARIEPDDADLSYLVNKIQGTQQAVGGSGDQMPLGGGTLTSSDIEIIRAWAQAGASNN
jgi:hypothetical protein